MSDFDNSDASSVFLDQAKCDRFERATESEYPIEALIEMSIASFLDLERSVLQIANQGEVSRALLKPVVLEQRKLSRERLSEVA